MNEVLIRKAVINGESSNIRKLLLTPAQVELVKRILTCDAGYTTARIAKLYKVSVQNAFAKLNRLYFAGYIYRVEREAATGGIEFIWSYKLNINKGTE